MGGRHTLRLLALAVPVAVLTARGAPGDESGRALVERHLRETIGFSGGDWRDVLAGKPVARNVSADDGREVPIFGAVRLPGDPERLVDWIRRIERFEDELDVLQVGRFASPPGLRDLASLTLPDQDISDIRGCEPGDCELQLPAAAMARFDAQVDWRAPDATARVNALYRDLMFDALRAYRTGGLAALPPHADRDPPTSIVEESRRLYHDADTPIPIPDLVRYLREYPRVQLPDAEEFFYWNLGDFGMKATARLNHVVIRPMPRARADATGVTHVIATQQVYASHYFSVTLELRTLVRDDQGDTPGFFLLYGTRSYVPGLSGFPGSLLRPIVRRRARSGMERYLEKTAALLARGPADPPPGGAGVSRP